MSPESTPFTDESPFAKRAKRVRAKSTPPPQQPEGELGTIEEVKKENARDRQRRARGRRDSIAAGEPIREEHKLRRTPRNPDAGDLHPAPTGKFTKSVKKSAASSSSKT